MELEEVRVGGLVESLTAVHRKVRAGIRHQITFHDSIPTLTGRLAGEWA
jgi:hypothetical protein